MTDRYAEQANKLVSDEELDTAWYGSWGENPNKRHIIGLAVLKIGADFCPGHTVTTICQTLGLVGKRSRKTGNINLTKKGRRYMFWANAR